MECRHTFATDGLVAFDSTSIKLSFGHGKKRTAFVVELVFLAGAAFFGAAFFSATALYSQPLLGNFNERRAFLAIALWRAVFLAVSAAGLTFCIALNNLFWRTKD